MSQSDEIWRKLTAAARQVPPPSDVIIPYGFSGRVAARALDVRGLGGTLVERFALRALGIAGLAAVLALATHVAVPSVGAANDDTLFSVDDPAAIVLGVNADE
ncbi:MAG: hypothetical protein IT582_01275 [Opitutaceae bacterium]|nr:hypothetical protein [Opitutaceae bacterium]